MIDEANASLLSVYKALEIIKKTPLDLVCENGHLFLLEYLLPKIEAIKSELPEDDAHKADSSNETLFATTRPTQCHTYEQIRLLSNTYTAVQRACEKGHFQIIKFIFTYYKNATPPQDCDLHHIDESTGENCALLAAKSGNLNLIKFLHREVKADFYIISKRRESALQLAIVGSRRSKLSFLSVIQYLCEEVRVNPTYEYEEALLLAEEKPIVTYLEMQLDRFGIKTTKLLLERKYAVKCNSPSENVKSEPYPSHILDDISQMELADISSIQMVMESEMSISLWSSY